MSSQGAIVTWALIISPTTDEPRWRGGFHKARRALLQPLRRQASHLQEPSGTCRRRPWLPLGQVKQSRLLGFSEICVKPHLLARVNRGAYMQ
eukprot:CCRYP_014297-RA/>CCRYP_014297-RA protein AED:0.38 eAED:0.56 QI:0/0/0/1/0/0/2/0/91